MPKISIIMGVYNSEDTLDYAIESILNQTFLDWEFIICDDCSTDNTYNILLDYYNKYPDKFVILRNEINSRLAASLNYCLKYATGEYIARMDADDYSLPDRLEKLNDFLDNHPEYQAVGSQMIAFDENGDKGIKSIIENPDMYCMRYTTPSTHATIMMRKYAYDKIGGYRVAKETRRCEDADMWFRFYAEGYQTYNIQEPLYKVRDDINAFKRRKLIYGLELLSVCFKGFRLLNYPIHFYFYLLKPLISSMMPSFIMKYYHEKFKDK